MHNLAGLGNGQENRPRTKVFQREFNYTKEIDQSFFMDYTNVLFRPKGVI
jgi:hypothetical protein